MITPTWTEGDPQDLVNFPPDFTPEKKLLAAVFSRCLYDLQSEDKLIKRSAEEWFFSNSRDKFSFLWIMEYLELSGDAVRIVVFAKKVSSGKLKGFLKGRIFQFLSLGRLTEADKKRKRERQPA